MAIAAISGLFSKDTTPAQNADAFAAASVPVSGIKSRKARKDSQKGWGPGRWPHDQAAETPASLILRPKDEQVGHCGMALLIFEAVKVLAIYPVAIRLVWFELHFQHAGLVISFVFGLPNRIGN